MDQLFKTQDEAITAARQWRSEKDGRVLYVADDPIHAMWGIGGFKRESVTDKVVTYHTYTETQRFLFPRFNRPLEAVFKKVSARELTEAMQAARPGFFAQADDAMTGRLQACRYDLDLGMSFVSWSLRSEVCRMPSDLRPIWQQSNQTSWVDMSGREALGGYAQERDRVEALLAPMIAP